MWWSLDTTEPVVAITFDDGPHPELTPRVLAVLADRSVTATFFMIGRHIHGEPRPGEAGLAAGRGASGQPSSSHRRVVDEDGGELKAEIVDGALALERLTGARPRWFRPPRGMVTGELLMAAAEVGEEVVLWSVTRGGPEINDARAVLHTSPAICTPARSSTSTTARASISASRSSCAGVTRSSRCCRPSSTTPWPTATAFRHRVGAAGRRQRPHPTAHRTLTARWCKLTGRRSTRP